ncbi:MAG: amidohydrolase family protein [Deltaproteobacteria bacterium]|nr:amidohydrolase family protein [Deltaproteobacteria bacterium]
MKIFSGGLLLLLSLGAHSGTSPEVLVLTGATVLPGTGGPPLPSAAVVIRGDRIADVGPADRTFVPEGARVVDLSGRWLVPGLIDAHVHFFQSGGLYTRPDVIDLRAVRPYAGELAGLRKRLPATLARYVACGITSVLDTGGPLWTFELRRTAAGRELAPRVAVAGPLLSSFVPRELVTTDPPNVLVRSAREARKVVRTQLARRPDVLKLWLVRWSGTPEEVAWVRAAVEESHAAGVRVAVHATELETARTAVETGADLLVHSVEDEPVDEGFLAALRRRKVVYIPTLAVNEGYDEVLGGAVRLSDFEKRFGDPQVISTWSDLPKLRPRRARRAPRDRAQAIRFENLRRVHAAGVTVAAGSDAGNIGTLHGPGLHRELELMREAGLSPAEVLLAATRGGAAALGREDVGTIEAGKLADLLVLDADPRKDVGNLHRIHRVVKGGRVFDPEEVRKGIAR